MGPATEQVGVKVDVLIPKTVIVLRPVNRLPSKAKNDDWRSWAILGDG